MRRTLLTFLFAVSIVCAACGGASDDAPRTATRQGVTPTPRATATPVFGLFLRGGDEKRMKEIVVGVLQSPTYLTDEVHAEFWKTLDKYGPAQEEIDDYREEITGMGTTYNKLFFTDALVAYKTGKAYKSSERQGYEEYLLGVDSGFRDQFRRNDQLMEDIATHQTLTTPSGQSYILDDEALEDSLANVDVAVRRLDKLFTRPD